MIANKIAIVTGGSEGIGFGIASSLAAQGVQVYLVARTLETLKKAEKKIHQQGGKVTSRAADITDTDAMKEIIEEVYTTHGRLDIFVNNAGGWRKHGLDAPFADIWQLIELDMKAPLAIAHHLAQTFSTKQDNNLGIVTIASQASLEVLDTSIGYGTAKMGLVAGLFHIREELAKQATNNVELYTIYPNTVATPKMIDAMKSHGVMDAVSVDSIADTALDLLSGKTETKDVAIGYQAQKGIVRKYLCSNPKEFYHPAIVDEEVVDADFNSQDLL